MHPLTELSLYYGEVDKGDIDYRNERRRANSEALRRRRGVQPFAASPFRSHTPPCTGCAFAQRCKEQELACNIFAEWSVSRRPVPEGIKQLLPSKRWMKLLSETEHLGPVRAAYYEVIEKQTGQPAPKTDDLFFDQR